jgi:hypothetical protein
MHLLRTVVPFVVSYSQQGAAVTSINGMADADLVPPGGGVETVSFWCLSINSTPYTSNYVNDAILAQNRYCLLLQSVITHSILNSSVNWDFEVQVYVGSAVPPLYKYGVFLLFCFF